MDAIHPPNRRSTDASSQALGPPSPKATQATDHAKRQTCTEGKAGLSRTRLPAVPTLQGLAFQALQSLACLIFPGPLGRLPLRLDLLKLGDVRLPFAEKVVENRELGILEAHLDPLAGVEVAELKVGQGIGFLVLQAR